MTSIAPDHTGELPPEDAGTSAPPIDRKLLIAGILAAVALAVVVATIVGDGDLKLLVYPVGAVVGVALLFLALTRFELFVLVCLFLRAPSTSWAVAAPRSPTRPAWCRSSSWARHCSGWRPAPTGASGSGGR